MDFLLQVLIHKILHGQPVLSLGFYVVVKRSHEDLHVYAVNRPTRSTFSTAHSFILIYIKLPTLADDG